MLSFLAKRFIPKRYRPGNLGNWSGHLPFANDLVAALRPNVLVELGTHYGESYFGLCQAVAENAVSCRCYAVDTWRGDQHAGMYDDSVFDEVNQYNVENYPGFSSLLRTTFDDARDRFADASIDFLHIDGLHTYDAVRHDFYSWLPKLRPGAVALLHDTGVRHADFGVWRLWEDLSREFAHFEFFHSWGLGVLRIPGDDKEAGVLKALFSGDAVQHSFLRQYYESQAENLDLRHRAIANVATVPLLTVYPCLPGGYSEATAVSTGLQTGLWERHTLALSQGSGAGPIRIDPADRCCIVELTQIVVRRAADGRKLAEWAGPALAQVLAAADLLPITYGTTTCFLATGRDPQLYLPAITAEVSEQPLLVEICIRALIDLNSFTLPYPISAERSAAEIAREFEDLENRIRFLQTELIEERRHSKLLQVEQTAHVELRGEHRLLQAELAEARRKEHGHSELLQGEKAAHADLRREYRLLQADLAEAYRRQSDNSELMRAEQSANAELRLKYEQERNTRVELLQSYSWRITAPLRGLYDLCGRVRRRKE
jgi:hypothetical protein